MNGEVHGMEEPMDTSIPNPSAPTMNLKIVNTESYSSDPPLNHCDNSNNTENSNHMSDHSQDAVGNYSENENSNDSTHQDIHDDRKPNISELSNENFNSVANDNHCSISNESYAESIDSNQKQESHQADMPDFQQDGRSKTENLYLERNSSRVAVATNVEDSDDEVDSEEDSSEEDGSDVSEEPRAEDTVSINSDSNVDGGDESSQERQLKPKASDIVILENDNRSETQNNDTRNSHSPEVHEIMSDNDDCVLAYDDKSSSGNGETKLEDSLRRSTRAAKRKRYDDDIDEVERENGDDESDIEEVTMEDPLNQFQSKSRPIVVNDTKELVEMASKQIKANQGNNQKKEPTVVIIDTNSILSGKGPLPVQNKNTMPSLSAVNTQNLYQSIAARGTTVTPVSGKQLINSATQSTTITPQPLILPSLTDDMFVVEAPSFIVPYVYEKPSIKPFREFVDTLGKELDDIKAKEEKIRLEKEKEEKEKQAKERKELGEDIEEEENTEQAGEIETKDEIKESVQEVEESPKKKNDKKDRKKVRNQNDDDDASWDGESSADSDDEVISDEENKTVVIKEKDDSIEEIKETIADLTTEKIITGKSDNYFDCSLGKFFINIGLNFVQEYVQHDLLKQQNRKLYKEKKAGHNVKATESAIASLMKNLEFSKENNAPYRFRQNKCDFCTFKTESMLVMAHHLETPHMKNNVYKCNFCAFEIRSPHDILYHMEAEHNIRGRLERAPAYHQCANCPFEDNGKGKLMRHLIPCAKKFKPEVNLAPPIEWEPPAKIPKITRHARNNMMGTYQAAFSRAPVNNVGRPPLNMGMMSGVVGTYRPRGRAPMGVPPRAAPVHGAPLVRGGVMMRHNAPSPVIMPNNYPMMQNNQPAKNPVGAPKMLHHQPSISITPLPRPPQPPQPQPTQHNKGTFVICEICDGYIKDLEQLRNHMQWIHKVKIHPKMIYNRPPLNCQKCQFRFFTDQGLERHLLGSHGLVTSSMQEAANKGKDAGRCPVCGRVYQWKLLNHVARDHNLTLKPAHLSYKCTVCTATFSQYKQFENHVYSAHSVVAKRVMDKTKTTTPPAKPSTNDSLLKPLKINDEITIIPQPAKPSTPTSTKSK